MTPSSSSIQWFEEWCKFDGLIDLIGCCAMSDLASTSGAGSPSLVSTLRQFRPRKRCLQQSTTPTTPLPDKCPEPRSEPNPPPSQNKASVTIPGTPEPASKKASRELAQSTRLECPNVQAPCSTSGLKESEAVGSGVKQRPVLSTASEGDRRPKQLQQLSNITAKKAIKIEGGVTDSLVKHTRYMTDRERSLKELRQEFKTTDIMNVLQALVACNWHVGQARTQLLNKTRLKGCMQQAGQGSEEDIKPNLASLNQALRKRDEDDFCSDDIYVKNLKGGLSKVKFLGGFRHHKQLPKAVPVLKEAQRPVEAAEDDSDNDDDCDENMYVKDLRGGLTELTAYTEPEESELPQKTTRLLRFLRRQ